MFDPVAMHHITIKDQHIYEEIDTSITYVLAPPAHAILRRSELGVCSVNELIFGKGLLATLGTLLGCYAYNAS